MADPQNELVWKQIKNEDWITKAGPGGYTYRRITGGWLVSVWAGDGKTQRWGGGLTFVPDPHGEWVIDEVEKA